MRAKLSNQSWTAPIERAGFVFSSNADQSRWARGFCLCVPRLLPTVIFVAALFAVLYPPGCDAVDWCPAFAVVIAWLMGTSGMKIAERRRLAVPQADGGNTTDDQPYLPRLTRSELLTVMTSGMAHVSGGVMAAYIAFNIEARHIRRP